MEGAFRAEAIDFWLPSFSFVSDLPSSSLDLPYLPKQMDYQAELNEIKVDYTAG